MKFKANKLVLLAAMAGLMAGCATHPRQACPGTTCTDKACKDSCGAKGQCSKSGPAQ